VVLISSVGLTVRASRCPLRPAKLTAWPALPGTVLGNREAAGAQSTGTRTFPWGLGSRHAILFAAVYAEGLDRTPAVRCAPVPPSASAPQSRVAPL
jgi:hypothetical protein